MKNLILHSRQQIQEQAQALKLKGRSKIKTYAELLEVMKKQGLNFERRQIMRCNLKLSNLHSKFQLKMDSLQLPEKPLKGIGNDRHEIDTIYRLIFEIPDTHLTWVSFRRKGGYFSSFPYVSSELKNTIYKYEEKRLSILKDFYLQTGIII